MFKIYNNFIIPKILKKSILLIGNFDGLHSGHQKIHKNWLVAEDELKVADYIIGDGSINALGSPENVKEMLLLLSSQMKPNAKLIQRIFIKHELTHDLYKKTLVEAFELKHYSEVRFLIYGVIADDDGVTLITAIEAYINELAENLSIEPSIAKQYKEDYLSWRNISSQASKDSSSTVFFPTREQINNLFKEAGISVKILSAGTFPLAEYTPLFVNISRSQKAIVDSEF